MKVELSELEKAFWQWFNMQGFQRRDLRNIRCGLKQFYRFLMKEEVLSESGLIDPTAITKTVIAEYQVYVSGCISSRSGERIKATTQTNRLVMVKLYCRFLKQTGRIHADPCVVIAMPRRAQQLPAAVMNAKEVRKLLDTPDPGNVVGYRNRTIMEIFWSTGMRVSEVADLQLEDINYTQASVLVREGKGGKKRLIPIGKAVLGWVREYVDRVRPLLIKPYRPETRTLFLSTLGTPVVTSTIMKLVGNSRDQAKLKKKISSHSFRHTLATEMLRGGADLRHIQQMLGHENLTTTQRYLQLVKADLKKVHRKTHPREALDTGMPSLKRKL